MFDEAVDAGARCIRVAQEIEIPLRSLRRWRDKTGIVLRDMRPEKPYSTPLNKLSEQERSEVLEVCNRSEYASLPPSQIVPRLADEGIYIASESTFYRVLKTANQQHHRGRSKVALHRAKPKTFEAREPNQVWCWDITYMPSQVRGLYWYLYAIIDIYSRKIVAWEVYDRECSHLASELVGRAVLREQCFFTPLVLHSDNGSPMKGSTLRAKLDYLGIVCSYSRPRVSNDNPYIESVFRTLKYCPQWPSKGFASLNEAREWMLKFDKFYNNYHRHSAIKFVTPNERHAKKDGAILAERKNIYEAAKLKHPFRWGERTTRNWTPIGSVSLNPERQITQEKAKA